jgi:ribonucleoside-diphosphate reductase alpha chain
LIECANTLAGAIAQTIALREQEKAGIQEELIPELVPPANAVGVPVVVAVGQPATQLPLVGYDPGETFIGTCPDCSSQLEFAEGARSATSAATASAGDFSGWLTHAPLP